MSIIGTSTDATGNKRIGWLPQVNKRNRETALTEHMELLRQYGDLYRDENQKQKASSILESFVNNQALVDDANALRQAIDGSEDYEGALKRLSFARQEAIKQNTGFSASMKNLGNIMKSVGASLLSGALYAGANWLIGKAFEYVEHQVNAAKYAKEALQEVSAEWDELVKKQESAEDLVTKYEKDYERLSKGVNMVTGENLSLTDDEYELFKQINSELADSALASVEGVTVAYDAQGQAIVRLSGQMDSLGDAYRALEQQTRNEIIGNVDNTQKNVQKILNSGAYSDIEYVAFLKEVQGLAAKTDEIKSEELNSWLTGVFSDNKRESMYVDLVHSLDGFASASGTALERLRQFGTQIAAQITKYSASMETTVAASRMTAKTTAENVWASDEYAGMSDSLKALGLSYFDTVEAGKFNIDGDSLIAWAESFAQQLADQTLSQSIDSLRDLQVDFVKGNINYGEYAAEAKKHLQSFMTDQWPEAFQQILNKSYGLDDASTYNKAATRLSGIVTDVSENWIDSLTADQLDFASTIDTGAVMTQTEYMSAYAESVAEAAAAVSTLSKNYASLTETQATAAEILATVGTTGALTLEQYEQLITANKDYADAVDASTGYLTVNWQKLREINKAQLADQEQIHRKALAANITKQTELRSEFDQLFGKAQLEALNTQEATRLELLEKELNVLIEEGNQLKTNLSNIKYMNSAYKQWLDAQEAGEKSDAFVAAKEAIEQIREGDKSGRRNTNKYQAALEYILGDATYRAASIVSRETALNRAESWYDDDGNFDLSAFRKSSIEAGAQKTTGEWTVGNIAEYAKLMGVSQEYMAHAILALSEYNGFEGVNVSKALQDQAKELLPTDPVDANTQAIVTNTEALNQVAALLQQSLPKKEETEGESTKSTEPEQGKETTSASVSVDTGGAVGDAGNTASELQKTIDALLAIAGKKLDLRIQQTAIDAASQLQSVLELLKEMPEGGYTIDVQNGAGVADAKEKLTAIESAIANVKALEVAGIIPVSVSANLTGTLQTQWNTIDAAIKAYETTGANVTVTATDNATSTINEITTPTTPYTATISVGLNQNTVTATEKEIARLQKEISDLEVELGVPDAKNTVGQLEQAAAQGKGLDTALSELGIDMQKALEAYGLINMQVSETGLRQYYDQMLMKAGHPAGGVREENTQADTKTSAEKQVEDMQVALAQLQQFAGVFEKSEYNLDAAMKQAGMSMSQLSELLSQFTQSEKDEAAVREYYQGMAEKAKSKGQGDGNSAQTQDVPALDASRLEAIVVATREANGDLSEALNSLGMTYEQAGDVYSRMFKIPEGSNPFAELQKYLEEQTQLEVLVGANTDSAIQTANAAVEAINQKTAHITVKTRLISTIGGLKSFAKGTRNAPGGLSLVGEAGPEIVVDRKDGSWFLAHYPQLVDLNPGDVVLNNDETQRAYGGKKGLSGRAYSLGTGSLSALKNRGDAEQRANSNSNTNNTNKPSNNTNGSDTESTKPPRRKGKSYDAILKQFEKLHDWIERALAVAQKKTQNIIDNIKDFVGYVAQNKQVDKALQSTRKEIELNQQAYVRYMEQASEVQDKLDLSDEIVQKIHEGVIDIESYDETTKKKIAEYQEWFEKAESCQDAIEELKDQERELQLQRLDNIVADYENRLDYIEDQSSKIQREIEYQQAVGMEVRNSSYERLIEGEQKKIATLQRERIALENEFNALVASGVIAVGSEDWHKYRNDIESVDAAIHDATISAAEFADEIYNLNLSKLQNLNTVLQSVQSNIEGIMSLHDAQGAKNVSEYYETLILNGHDQITNLKEQNDLIREQMEGLDKDSEKYQKLLDELTANEEAITGIKVSQEQWNDSISDLKIDSLQEEREALEKTNEEYQKQLDLEEALEALAKAKNQRTKLVYREGRGFVYESDQEAIDAAQKQVDDLMHQAQLDAIDDQIDAIEDSKEHDNVWSYDGSTLLKSGDLVPDAIYSAIQEMLTAALPEEVYAQTAVAEALQTTSAPLATQISIGDIIISDATNAEALAKDIVSNLPNAILQEMHKS